MIETPNIEITSSTYTARLHGYADVDGLRDCLRVYGEDFLVGDFFDFAFHGSPESSDYVSSNILGHPSVDWFIPIMDVMYGDEYDPDECGNIPYGVISWTSDGCHGDDWCEGLARGSEHDCQYVFEIVTDDAFEHQSCLDAYAVFVPNGDVDEERFDNICHHEVVSAFAELFSQTVGMLRDDGVL